MREISIGDIGCSICIVLFVFLCGIASLQGSSEHPNLYNFGIFFIIAGFIGIVNIVIICLIYYKQKHFLY